MTLNTGQNISPGKLVWQRFRKDWWAMGALVYLVLCSLIGLLGYLITPDSTPDADYQTVEVALAPPNSRIEFLRFPKPEAPEHNGIVKTWLYGKRSKYTLVPVKEVHQENDKLIVQQYLNFTKEIAESRTYEIEKDGLEKEQFQTSKRYLLGTDRFGRDVLSRMMIGTRITMMVGFIAVFISLIVGVFLGSLAGYFKGWVDKVISWMINVTWSIPTLLLVLTITISIGKGLIPVFIAVGLTMWVDVARIVRGEIFSLREREFIRAGKALGFGSMRIIFKHILPNIMASILVVASANFAAAILIESGLSFLGLGAQPPTPTWGNMIESHRNFIITSHAHLAIIPGFAILLLVLSFTMVSSGLKNVIGKN